MDQGAGRRFSSMSVALAMLTTLFPVVMAPPGLAQPAEQGTKKSAKEIELEQLQTPTSRTRRAPDGTFTTSLYTAPIQFEDEHGEWQPIDSELVPTSEDGYDLTNRANSFDVLLQDHLGPDFMQLDVAGDEYRFGMEGAAPAAGDAQGASLTYSEAYPGVNLKYDVIPQGVKETLILRNAQVPTSYTFSITPPEDTEIEAEKEKDGSWAFLGGGSDAPAFVLLPPTVSEAAGAGQANTEAKEPVDLKVSKNGTGGFQLHLSVDRRWLQDPSRKFPVLVDPTINMYSDILDASFKAGPNCPDGCGAVVGSRLNIGSDATYLWRGGLKFDLGDLPTGANIESAQLELLYDQTCIGVSGSVCGPYNHTLDVHRATSYWDATSKSVSFDPTVIDSDMLYLSEINSAKPMTWDVTQTLSNWLSGLQTNHGFVLKKRKDLLNTSGPMPPARLYADPTLRPRLDVRWTSDGVTLEGTNLLRANGADLTWTRYVGASGAPFQSYEIHRSSVRSFTPSPSTLIGKELDSVRNEFKDTTARAGGTFTYKIVTNGAVSNPQTVTLPPAGEAHAFYQPGPRDGRAVQLNVEGVNELPNNGALSYFRVGTSSTRKYRSLLWFPLRGIDPNDVKSAKLSLYHEPHAENVGPVDVYRLKAGFAEGTGKGASGDTRGATWFQRTGNWSPWVSKGGDFAPTRVSSVTAGANEGPGWHELDVTTAVAQWKKGANLGLLLKAADETLGSGKQIYYYSDDFTVAPLLRPKLKIVSTASTPVLGPEGAITSPVASSTVSGSATITADVSDDSRVDRVDFSVVPEGKSPIQLGSDKETPYSTSWETYESGDPTGSADQLQTWPTTYNATVRATAYDNAGNQTILSSVPVAVDNSAAPHSVGVTGPQANQPYNGTVAVTANASDDIRVTKVEFYVDGVLFGVDDTAPYSTTWNTLDPNNPTYDDHAPDPQHELTARAYDAGGRVTVSPEHFVSVNNTRGTKYQARIESADVPQMLSQADPLQNREVTAMVTNLSDTTWGADATQPPLYLGYRWYRPDGTVAATGQGMPLLAPGETLMKNKSKSVSLKLASPPLDEGVQQGRFELRIDLYEKLVDGEQWFANRGNRPLVNPVIVNKVLTYGVGNHLFPALGLERYYQYDRAGVGAGMTHYVNVANGNSLLHWTPFQSPGRGLSTVVGLTYNSLEDHSDSPVGNNFSLSISGLTRMGMQLEVHPKVARPEDPCAKPDVGKHYVDLIDGDGTPHRFQGSINAAGVVEWEEPPGVNLWLRRYSCSDPSRFWALTRPDRVTFFFDSEGYPTSVEDKNGNRIKFELAAVKPGDDPGGAKKRIVAIVDPAGTDSRQSPDRTYKLDYYERKEAKNPHVRGKVQTIRDHNGSTLFFEYYDDGNLLRVTQCGVSQKGDCSDVKPRRSFVFTYTTSNSDGPAIADESLRRDPAPKTPNQSSHLYSVRDPRGKETLFDYYAASDGPQLRWKLQKRVARDPQEVTTYDYSPGPTGGSTTVTAPLKRSSTYGYDQAGLVQTMTNGKGEVTRLSWDADFHLDKLIEPSVQDPTQPGRVTDYTYNSNGYLTEVTDAEGNKTLLAYENKPIDDPGTLSTDAAGHISQLTKVTKPKGVATEDPDDYRYLLVHDDRGNLLSVKDPLGFTTTYTPNPDGTIASVTDANGNITRFPFYHPSGQPTEVTDPVNGAGAPTRMGYDEDGLLRWVQDPAHAGSSGTQSHYRTELFYDEFHRPTRQSLPKSTEHDPGNLIWSETVYDLNDNVIAQTSPEYSRGGFVSGPQTTIEYDDMDRPRIVTGPDKSRDPRGERTTYEYDGAGRVTRVTSPEGNYTTGLTKDRSVFYDYDLLDRVLVEKRYASESEDSARRTHYCYYPGTGDLKSVTAPKASLLSVDCSSAALDYASTTPLKYTTRFKYDKLHRTQAVKDPLQRERSVQYDPHGNMEWSTDAENGRVERVYDQRDMLSTVTEPFKSGHPVVTKYGYDGNGNMTLFVSPRAWDAQTTSPKTFNENSPFVTSYQYDGLNRLVRTSLPTSGSEARAFMHREYDRNGNLAFVSLATEHPDIDPLPAGVEKGDLGTSLTYFDTGWMKTSRDPGRPTIHFDYEPEGWQSYRVPEFTSEELAAQSDPQGELNTLEEMRWIYLPDGTLETRKDPGMKGEITYDYDADNLLTTAKDSTGVESATRNPVQTTFEHDPMARLVKSRVREFDGVTETPWTTTRFTYDPNGNVSSRADNGTESADGTETDAGRTSSFVYDEADQLREQQQGDPSGCRRIVSTYTRNGWADERTIYRETNKLGCNRADNTWTQKQRTNRDYHPNGKVMRLQTFRGLSEVLVEDHQLGYVEGPASAERYVNGHRTLDQFFVKGGQQACTTACTARYVYDARDRLTSHDRGDGRTTAYALDVVGNIKKETRPDGTSTSYTYVGSLLDTATTGADTARYHYDPDGNLACVTDVGMASCPDTMTTGVRAMNEYDDLNRLVASYRKGGYETSYTYDALDRVALEEETGTITRTTEFSYLGATGQQTEEVIRGLGAATKSYTYDAFGGRVGMTRTAGAETKSYTYGYDPHGSVSLLLDENQGAAPAAYGYGAYGSLDPELSKGDTDQTDPLNPYRYTAKRFDAGAQNYDMGARRFDAGAARFLQHDALSSALGNLGLSSDPLTQNRYSLAGGNPVSYIEVDGHRVESSTSGSSVSTAERNHAMEAARNYSPTGSGGGDPQPTPSPSPSRTPSPEAAPTPDAPIDKSTARALSCSSGDWSCLGWDVLQQTANVSSGIASVVTIRQSDRLQEHLGVADEVDRDAWNYKVGEASGAVGGAIVGGAVLKTLSQAALLARLGRSTTRGNSGGAGSINEVVAGLRAGRSPGVRVVDSADELDDIFQQLSRGGEVIESSYHGKLVRLPDEATIGIRPTSTSGGPAIDIKLPSGDLIKIHVSP